MQTDIHIHITYTSAAAAAVPGIDPSKFTLGGNVPFPVVGDRISFAQRDDATFLVATREFVFSDERRLDLILVLDLVPKADD